MSDSSESAVPQLVDHLFRSRAGQMVAWLTRRFGPEHLELAEEVVQDALVKALQQWPLSGVPRDPTAWLFAAARNAALDVVRRNAVFSDKSAQLAAELERSTPSKTSMSTAALDPVLRDDELAMIFLCCHPTLSRDARIALSLKTVGGFSTEEIARAFLCEERTIAQRLVRAKRQIRDSKLRFELGAAPDLNSRLEAVLEAIYLMFNEGYTAHHGEDLIRDDVCREALRLACLVADSGMGTPAAHALAALLAFHSARMAARTNAAGDLVLLEDQDRSLWHHELIELGFENLEAATSGTTVTAYHVQATIAATHAAARSAAETDWPAILALYDQLLEMTPTPVVALNRAVALAKVRGPHAGLLELDKLTNVPELEGYYLLPSVRGSLLLEIGNYNEAAQCFRQALDLPCSEPEKRFLRRKLAECQD